jgi:predicted Asp-tRNA(Asn)/Glu-tRNA(Gln) amidotransferase subunit C
MERIDTKQIEKEAKQILDKFAKALEKVEEEHDLNFYVDREEFERAEGEEKEVDGNFRQKILENAPDHDNDFIIAEKGSWKK